MLDARLERRIVGEVVEPTLEAALAEGFPFRGVLASAGYPGDYSAGKTITGINEAERLDGVVVFHAGTKFNADGEVETSGGRVLGVTTRRDARRSDGPGV